MPKLFPVNKIFKNRQRLRSRPAGGVAIENPDGLIQDSYALLSGETTDATPTNLAAADGDAFLGLEDDQVVHATVEVVAVQTGGAAGTPGDSQTWLIHAVVRRGTGAGSTAVVDAITEISNIGDLALAAAVDVVADAVNGGLAVEGTGEADKDISWTAKVRPVVAGFGS